MDIRFEVLRINRVWTLTESGPDLTRFGGEGEAVEEAIRRAKRHHEETGGEATVHLWRWGNESIVFDTEADGRGISPNS